MYNADEDFYYVSNSNAWYYYGMAYNYAMFLDYYNGTVYAAYFYYHDGEPELEDYYVYKNGSWYVLNMENNAFEFPLDYMNYVYYANYKYYYCYDGHKLQT